MLNDNAPWDDEKVEYLKAEWVKMEKSASVLAAEIGVTKSAVIGKARRLKLPSRRSGAHIPKRERKPRKSRAKANGHGGGSRFRLNRPSSRPERIVARRQPSARRVPTIQPDPGPTGPNGGIPFLDLADHHCRWPLDNGNFCGGDIPDVFDQYCPKYCYHHKKRATVPVTPGPYAHLKRWRY